MTKAIIFDLWETLGTKNIGISKTLRDKFHIKKTSNFLVKYERSIQLKEYGSYKELSENFLKNFSIKPTESNINFVINTLKQGINKASLFEGMYELVEYLSKEYDLGILSNTTCFESQVATNLRINKFFKAQIYSCQIGSIKPNHLTFEAICNVLAVSPNEAIFIDDGKKNIVAAKKFGLTGIQYKNINQLKKELASYHINIPSNCK